MTVDPAAFSTAVLSASSVLDRVEEAIYDPQIFIDYTRHIIEKMGGSGSALDACAREIYEEWATCQHFHLYEEVPDVLRALADKGLRLGLISNTHRSLEAFQTHFLLDGLVSAAVSSAEHGYMKPHPSIFRTTLELLGASADESVMVGDSFAHDIEGARQIGMRGILIVRSGRELTGLSSPGVPVIRSLRELERHL